MVLGARRRRQRVERNRDNSLRHSRQLRRERLELLAARATPEGEESSRPSTASASARTATVRGASASAPAAAPSRKAAQAGVRHAERLLEGHGQCHARSPHACACRLCVPWFCAFIVVTHWRRPCEPWLCSLTRLHCYVYRRLI